MSRRNLQRLLLVTLLSLGVGYYSGEGGFQRIDRLVIDHFFEVRHSLGLDPPIDPRILLVRLDRETFEEIGQPVSRWCDDYARATEFMLGRGAATVGLDIVYAPSLGKLNNPEVDHIWSEIAQLAELCLTRPVVLVDAYRGANDDLTSIKELHFVADDQGNVAYNNMLTDSDGKVRTLGLFFRDQPPFLNRNFAGRLAQLGADHPITSVDGRISGLVSEGSDRMRINYPGPPDVTFPSISMAEILQRKSVPLKNRICIVGPVEDANDLHVTPFGATLGVEIHAAALNTILTGRYLEQAPSGIHLILCLLGAYLAFWLATRAPDGILSITATVGLASYLGILLVGFALFDVLLPITGPLLVTLLVGSEAYVLRYLALVRSRRYVKGLLGRFVSPEVMKELLAKPENVQLGGRRHRITILFCDINNFTPLCEEKSPEEVIAMLNMFFEEMLEIIFRHGGTVKQFVGDEIMVLYGAPEVVPDHAARAVRTAVDMMERLKFLRSEKGEGAGFYDVKIAIHTGEAVVGNVGNEKRSEYAAVGDTVNTTARIEALTKEVGEPILVSEETMKDGLAALPGIEFVSKGTKSFKGKTGQLEVFGIRWHV